MRILFGLGLLALIIWATALLLRQLRLRGPLCGDGPDRGAAGGMPQGGSESAGDGPGHMTTAAVMRCPHCSRLNDHDANFCQGCGREIVRPQRCRECGSVNDPDAVFCRECGRSFGGGTGMIRRS